MQRSTVAVDPSTWKVGRNTVDYNEKEAPWDIKAAEWIGKAMPNEVTKIGGGAFGKIPYLGWLMKAMGALDQGGTKSSDIYFEGKKRGLSDSTARMNGVSVGMNDAVSSIAGSGGDPGEYGSSGNKRKSNWADYVGLATSLYSSSQSKNKSGMIGAGMNIYDATRGDSNWNYGKNYYDPQPSRDPEWESWVRAAGQAGGGKYAGLAGKVGGLAKSNSGTQQSYSPTPYSTASSPTYSSSATPANYSNLVVGGYRPQPIVDQSAVKNDSMGGMFGGMGMGGFGGMGSMFGGR